MLVPGLDHLSLPILKSKAFLVILTIGQTFFSQGLSSNPVLLCSVDSLHADSVIFSIQLRNAHSPAMEDYARSGLPLTVSFCCTVQEVKSSKAIRTFRYTHRAQMDIAKGRVAIRKSYDESHHHTNAFDSCWTTLFRVGRVAVWATPLEEKEFRLSVGAHLEKVHVKPMNEQFDPGLFWRGNTPGAQSPPVIYKRYRPPKQRFKKGKA